MQADDTEISDEGTYKVKHQNEKFSIDAAPRVFVKPGMTEEEQLREDLLKIKEMEANEKLRKADTDYISEYLEQGPHVYELYSVLVHSGSAFGGHYYAYIKSFDDGKWYNFNDS